jgi:hypothetical protein
MRSASFQLSQDRDRSSQKYRSDHRSFGRRSCRFKMASCWRKARFSNASSERSLRAVGIIESSRKIVRIMNAECLALGPRKSTVSMRPGIWRMTGQEPRLHRDIPLDFAAQPMLFLTKPQAAIPYYLAHGCLDAGLRGCASPQRSLVMRVITSCTKQRARLRCHSGSREIAV